MLLRLKQALLIVVYLALAGAAFWYVFTRGNYGDLNFWFVVALWACAVVIVAVVNARWSSGADSDRGGFEVIINEKKKD